MLARLSVWSEVQVVCTLYMDQLTPLPLTVNCFSKIQIGFTFLVPAHPGSLGPRAVKRVCGVCVFALHNFRIILVLVFRLRTFACLVMLTMRFFSECRPTVLQITRSPHVYLPERSETVYSLCSRNHDKSHITKTSDLNDRHF